MTSTRRLAWSMTGLAMALVLVSVIRAQDWESSADPSHAKFRRIVFLDDTTGFIVGATADGKSGVILQTTDGGDAWKAIDIKRAHPLTAADCARSICVAVGERGTVLRSRDSVRSWMALDEPTRRSLRGIAMIDADGKSMVAVGDGGTILRSTDGGTKWKSVKSPTGKHLRAVAFADASVGWAVGDAGTILLTIDGGLTWTAQTSGTPHALTDLWMRDRSWGWAVGERGTALMTTDGGATWEQREIGEKRFLSGVTFLDERRGFIVGSEGGIWETRDSGATWTETESDTNVTIRDVTCSESYFCHAAGDEGTTLLFVAGAPGEEIEVRKEPVVGGPPAETPGGGFGDTTAASPDLVPDAFRVDASGNLEVVARNIGTSALGGDVVGVTISYRDAAGAVLGTEVRTSMGNTAAVDRGGVTAIVLTGTDAIVPAGATQVVVTVDPQDAIHELDDQNNTVTFPLPELPRPDLAVTDVTLRPENGRIRATIRNSGPQAWSGALGISFTPKVGTAAPWGSITTSLPATTQLAANDGTVTFDLAAPVDPTTETVEVRIDPAGAVTERDEQNNTATLTMPKPDFVVSEIIARPENGRLRAAIRNTGTRPWIGPLGISFIPKNATGQAAWGAISTTLPSLTSLPVGGSILFDLATDLDPSAVVVEVRIDTANAVGELHEDNNASTFPVPEVSRPDFVVSELTPRPGTTRLRVTVRNMGTSAWSGALGISVTPKNAAGQAAWGVISTQLPVTTQLSARDGVVQFDLPTSLPAQAATAEVQIDAANAVRESNEQNNATTFPVPKPDFVVSEVTTDPATGFLRIVLQNVGSVPWTGSMAVTSQARDTAGVIPPTTSSGSTRANTTIPPNGTYVKDFGVEFNYLGTIRATVDSTNLVTEANEQNNELIVPIPLSDLLVESFGRDGQGHPVITIHNRGRKRYVGDVGLQLRYLDAADAVVQEDLVSVRTTSIVPGASRPFTLTTSIPSAATRGVFTVDHANRIREEDEQNNVRTQPLP
ncbi:hypothetical protein HY632_02735 [Candidatus Uhrbacteria bacterium]|nr:hypothetical protein [Candidatus Uhrbacteria bacterium]